MGQRHQDQRGEHRGEALEVDLAALEGGHGLHVARAGVAQHEGVGIP